MRYESAQFSCLHYLIRYPHHYCETERHPAILFLHGAGGRGSDLEHLKTNPYFQITDKAEGFPFLTFAPQCHMDTWFDLFETLIRFAEAIASRPDVDSSRIYVMGASMGGFATWQIAMSRPDLFAAIIPICGGGMYWNAGRLAGVPVWAFHGAKDQVVLLEESRKMTDAVNKNGGCARLTIYPENEHNAWSDTYTNPEVFRWLLAQENKNIITGRGISFP